MLLEFGFEALKERKCVSRPASKASEHFIVMQSAHLAGTGLDDHVPERNLAVAAERDTAVAPDRNDRGAVELFQSVAVELLAQLAPLLRFERERCGGPGKQAR